MAPESRDEVRQRINTLYDQAENATGNYNATRAMSGGSRGRGVPLRKRSGGGSEPALDAISRQWFDGVRAKLGPTVPAVLPTDRMPQRPAERRPAAPLGDGLPGAELALPELTASGGGRQLPEPTGGPVAELTGRPRAELTARPVTALPAVPEPRRELEPAAGDSRSAPAAESRRPSPATSKERNQRKLAAARDLLGRAAVQRSAPVAAIEAPPAQDTWTARDALTMTGTFGTGSLPAQPSLPPATADASFGTGSVLDTGSYPTGDALTDTGAWTGMTTGMNPLTDTGAFPAANPLTDMGSFTAGGALTDTGAYAAPAYLTDAGAFTAPAPLTDTGSYAAVAPMTDTGTFTAPVLPIDSGAFATPSPLTDTGMFATPAPPTDTGSYAAVAPLTDTGGFAAVSSVPSAYAGKAMKALAFARAQIGKPCVWGATGPDSYDCSSLTQGAWRAAGVVLPRGAAEQASAGTPVTLATIEVGDLVFFFDTHNHVGLYTGNGMMIHAPGPGSSISEESIYGAGESAIQRVIRPA
ncbi:C40 family peptidase [Streptomyces olivochromogenes]|uniref:C40 family peptidase n=1 Tax=Streptomyces olivochromogenes TaxID=1963 RepID=UPI001F242FC3|nr:C40 family peptidase [Streptomyces olivochromogenes]